MAIIQNLYFDCNYCSNDRPAGDPTAPPYARDAKIRTHNRNRANPKRGETQRVAAHPGQRAIHADIGDDRGVPVHRATAETQDHVPYVYVIGITHPTNLSSRYKVHSE